MTVREGICDYCGRERLLETGDERSKIQFGKLWCGTCREGSRQRYIRMDDERIEGQVKVMQEMLDQHPLRWEPPYDHFRMHLFKFDYQDEIWRMQNELKMRAED